MACYTASKDSSETQFEDDNNGVDSCQEYPHEDDDNPFFDFDFTLPMGCDYPLTNKSGPSRADCKEAEELRFSFSVLDSINVPNTNQPSFPSDNLTYEGQLLPLQASRSFEMARQHGKGSLTVNGVKSQLNNLFKTANKLKISRFRLKKSSRVGMDLQDECGKGKTLNEQRQSKYFVVKFKMVDFPLFFRFVGDNSRVRVSKRDESRRWPQRKTEDSHHQRGKSERHKKKLKGIVQKYMKMIEPLYSKIFQRYSEKAKHEPLKKSGVANGTINSGLSRSERVNKKQLSFYDKLKMVCKPSCKQDNSSFNVKPPVPGNYSESTIMELQNAIQGAIAHCKRSNYTEDTPSSTDWKDSTRS